MFSRDFQTFIETLLPHLRSSFLFGVRQLGSVFKFNYFFFCLPGNKFVLAFFFSLKPENNPLFLFHRIDAEQHADAVWRDVQAAHGCMNAIVFVV